MIAGLIDGFIGWLVGPLGGCEVGRRVRRWRAAAARRRRRWRRAAADASGVWRAVCAGGGGRTVGHGRRQQQAAGVGSGDEGLSPIPCKQNAHGVKCIFLPLHRVLEQKDTYVIG